MPTCGVTYEAPSWSLLRENRLVDAYAACDALLLGCPCGLIHVKRDVPDVVRAAEPADIVDTLQSSKSVSGDSNGGSGTGLTCGSNRAQYACITHVSMRPRARVCVTSGSTDDVRLLRPRQPPTGIGMLRDVAGLDPISLRRRMEVVKNGDVADERYAGAAC